jgi:hypothetical protein
MCSRRQRVLPHVLVESLKLSLASERDLGFRIEGLRHPDIDSAATATAVTARNGTTNHHLLLHLALLQTQEFASCHVRV